MRILYIFPHPDDESFGPAGAINQQLKAGHQVYLLTLTKGGATRQRHALGLSIEEMGEVRLKEMLEVEKVLGLSGMTVLDFPDSGLKEIDPRTIEEAISKHIEIVKPDILVSYPVHGISGFHDHLVTHAVVKRVYLDLKGSGAAYLKRLAFFTIIDSGAPSMVDGKFRFKHSEPELIDCILHLTEDDRKVLRSCLDCYKTYQSTINATNVAEKVGQKTHFEFFMEHFDPPVEDLTDKLEINSK